ncbi:MAG: DUF4270 family protein [Flavobacteriales bacterium]|nr:DUF4270 family protein [Flavobacteriales bacterium]
MRFKGSGVVLFLLAVLAFAACKDPENIGLDVLPAGEQMPIAWIDTFTLEARTVYYDSVPTSSASYFLVGDFGDPIFGSVRSSVFFKYAPTQTDYDFSSAQEDSIFLNLTYAGYYGNADKLKGIMTFGVFELVNDLGDSTYYSTSNPTLGDQIGEITFRPDLYSKIIASGDTLAPGLRIRLDNSFAHRILYESNTSSSEAFWETFKGLAVKPVAASMPGFGSILYFDMTDRGSRLELYYHNSDNSRDSVICTITSGNGSGLHSRFEHDYSTEITSAISGTTVAGATNVYTQSMAGLRFKVRFPFIRELNNLGVIAINKAELVIPVDTDVDTDYDLPTTLSANGIKGGDTATYLIDYFEGPEYYGGILDETNNEYVFNVARYVQGLLNSPTQTDYGLFITNLGNAVNARRGVYNGPAHPDRPMKLRITYTIIE